MKCQARLLSAGSWLCGCLVIMLMAANPVVPEASMFNGTGMWLALCVFTGLYILPMLGKLIKIDYGYYLLTGWLAINLLLFIVAGVPVVFSVGALGLRLLLGVTALLGLIDLMFWLPQALVPERPLQET